tara:strand:+ start:1538 stop:3001 length:1464 start_codon:yes stop_codon:yes gene_type:complete
MTERAGYLPGLSVEEVAWQTLAFERAETSTGAPLEVAVPVLTETQMRALATRVREASRHHLKTRTVAEIIDIIDRAIARLLDRGDPYRRKAEELLPIVSGYDSEMVRLGLTEYFKTFRKPELAKFLSEDFANPQILDDFQPVPKGGFARAFGPDLLVHIWAGNVPGLPLWSFVSGLLVKAGSIGKVPSAEPLFAGWFARLLAEIEPDLAECFAVVWWQGGDTASEGALLGEADTVLAYGGNDSLAAIRDRLPVTTRYLAHGHKVSFGMVSRDALDSQKAWSTAHDAAYDVVRYDQQGCYSPHLFFVERGGKISPQEFSRNLAHELACFEEKFPRRSLTIAESGDVAAWRHAEEMKSLSQPDRELMGDAAGAWSVAYVEEAEELAPSGLNRTIRVVAIDDLRDTIPLIAPFKALLQTVGIAAAPEALFRLAALLGEVGVTRISALGRMSAPEAGWHHDGRFNLLDLVTLTEIERSAEQSAETFAPYVD